MQTGNALEGFQCPKCNRLTLLIVRAEAVLAVRKDSIQLYRDGEGIEWSPKSYARCKCGFEGTVKDFDTRIESPE